MGDFDEYGLESCQSETPPALFPKCDGMGYFFLSLLGVPVAERPISD
jgi:hypothetical protein